RMGILREALAPLLDDTLAIFIQLSAALDRYSETLASRSGLRIVPRYVRNLPRFTGVREGARIKLRQARQGDGMRLQITIPDPVDDGLVLRSKQQASGAEVPMLDPILDGHVAVETAQPEAVRTHLGCDQVREDVLALVMGYPDAQVSEGTITVTIPSCEPAKVLTAIDDALALARSLSVKAHTPDPNGAQAAHLTETPSG
ncbi:MAG TPA: hypothetical protein DFR83_15475, partial [Deltaproteobacteria bacterium]|nr:hypothetical protein [Deltaproteobacteria bacterium]